MNSTPNTLPNFSRGCPCVPVDGDIAVQEEQTVSRLELHSINFVNSPVLASKSGLDALLVLSGPLLSHGMYEFFFFTYKLQLYTANTRSLPLHFLSFLSVIVER